MSTALIIKSLRQKKNFSQQYLANHLRVSRSLVAQWETGKSVPSYEALPHIATILGVSIHTLVTGQTESELTSLVEEPAGEPAARDGPVPDALGQNIAYALRKLIDDVEQLAQENATLRARVAELEAQLGAGE